MNDKDLEEKVGDIMNLIPGYISFPRVEPAQITLNLSYEDYLVFKQAVKTLINDCVRERTEEVFELVKSQLDKHKECYGYEKQHYVIDSEWVEELKAKFGEDNNEKKE